MPSSPDTSSTSAEPPVRVGNVVDLRRHHQGNRETFIRWYTDPEIAELLRHDLMPLTPVQAQGYFDSVIMPSSARGTCWAVHEREGGRLIGTAALADVNSRERSCMFRIVIGEKTAWGHGNGTEATQLAMQEAFETHGMRLVKLEVFDFNVRAQRAYERVGFRVTGRHVEWVPDKQVELHVVEMQLTHDAFEANARVTADQPSDH